jgi:hypothetical protein
VERTFPAGIARRQKERLSQSFARSTVRRCHFEAAERNRPLSEKAMASPGIEVPAG